MKKKKLSAEMQLRIARAQLSAFRRATGPRSAGLEPADFHLSAPHVESVPFFAPPKFVQCWAVNRGYSSFTQALDNEGQVWELFSKTHKEGTATVVDEQWWVPISMERRKPVEKTAPDTVPA